MDRELSQSKVPCPQKVHSFIHKLELHILKSLSFQPLRRLEQPNSNVAY